MDDVLLDKVLAYADGEFRAFCESAGLVPPAGPVDKYGSYVFETGKRVEDLNRSIAMALMPERGSDRIRIEFQFAVDDGWRYTSESATRYNEAAFALDVLAGRSPAIAEVLRTIWFSYVLKVTRDDLTEEYVVPRPAPGADHAPTTIEDFREQGRDDLPSTVRRS